MLQSDWPRYSLCSFRDKQSTKWKALTMKDYKLIVFACLTSCDDEKKKIIIIIITWACLFVELKRQVDWYKNQLDYSFSISSAWKLMLAIRFRSHQLLRGKSLELIIIHDKRIPAFFYFLSYLFPSRIASYFLSKGYMIPQRELISLWKLIRTYFLGAHVSLALPFYLTRE